MKKYFTIFLFKLLLNGFDKMKYKMEFVRQIFVEHAVMELEYLRLFKSIIIYSLKHKRIL